MSLIFARQSETGGWPATPLDEFEAQNFPCSSSSPEHQKLQHEGRVIYCQNQATAASLVPYKGCITETALRLRVENARRARNSVAQTRVPPG